MSLNKTKIEWTDYTWNPVVGCYHWKNLCAAGRVCYARKMARRQRHKCEKCYKFIPHIHEERLQDPYKLRKPAKVFVCSMGDLFGEWVPDEWIEKIIDIASHNSHLIFQFLTKNPARYREFQFPPNCWLGTTVNRQSDVYRIVDLVEGNERNIKFVSFEPLYGEIRIPDRKYVDWIIIGAQTNPHWLPKPEWVKSLIEQARDIGAAIFLKDNLNWPVKIQEFPL
jgi:protein gp37